VTPPEAATAPEGGPTASFKDRARTLAHAAIGPLVRGMVKIGVTADALTVLGCLLSVAAAFAFFEGAFQVGAGLMLASGACDLFDGEIARAGARVTRFGAFLDSTLDRIGESLVLGGLAGFYVRHLVELASQPTLVMQELARGLEPVTWAVVGFTAILALIGSFMVSYTRARAEGLGLSCKVGWFERPERMVLLILAAFFGVGPVMPAALLLLAVLSFATAAQRVAHVWKHTRAG
jgi:CDP-diacylglycerol--glycerol-3-phosphate 3-phosphatidyltransferase